MTLAYALFLFLYVNDNVSRYLSECLLDLNVSILLFLLSEWDISVYESFLFSFKYMCLPSSPK